MVSEGELMQYNAIEFMSDLVSGIIYEKHRGTLICRRSALMQDVEKDV